ncbi:MAG: ABC transporter permease [Phycisphaerales bacterium]|nr:ABC transporter permease [Phycisphaerales bacterium]
MSLARLVRKEIRHRPLGAVIGAGAVAIAVAVVTFLWGVAVAGERETRLIQRDIGLNLVIVPETTRPETFFATGQVQGSMPEEYIDRVADQDVANRLIPMVRRTMRIDGHDVVVVGIAEERFKRDNRMKPVFGRTIEPGSCVLGSAAAAALQGTPGGSVTIADRAFTIANVLAATGSEEDARVYLDLADAQQALDLSNRITEIRALECHCGAEVEDPAAWLAAELGPLLPGTRVLRLSALAEARRQQRLLAERYLGVAGPVVVVLSAVVVCLLAILNVRERRAEIGVLRSIGWGSNRIGAAIVLRAAILGLLGAVPGVLVGTVLVEAIGARLFAVAWQGAAIDLPVLASALVLAPAFAACAAFIPAAIAIREDPAEILREA